MMIENLESRVLLTAFVSGGTLFIRDFAPIGSGAISFQVTTDGAFYHVITSGDGFDDFFPVGQVQRIDLRDTVNANTSDSVGIGSNVAIPATISTGWGDDFVSSGGGTTLVFLGFEGTAPNGFTDNDSFSASVGAVSVQGGSGNDTLIGGSGNDSLDGGAGVDSIDGSDGNDSLLGRDGNDSVIGNDGDDTILGGAGVDYMDGGLGGDVLSYEDRTTSVAVKFNGTTTSVAGTATVQNNIFTITENDVFVEASFETIWGGTANDSLDASFAGTVKGLLGLAGNDVLIGSDFFDSNFPSGDTLDGGLGNDVLSGLSGNDLLLGGLGNDNITGGFGADSLYGGTNGLDQETKDGADTLRGGDDPDLLDGEAGNDQLNGDLGNDTMLAGPDIYFVIPSLILGVPDDSVKSGSDTFQGGNGLDVVDYSSRSKAVRVSIDANSNDGDPTENFGLGEADSITSTVEKILGGNGGDTMSTTFTGNVWLIGNGGNDSLVSGNGDDTLEGGNGNDTLNGGIGADSMIGGANNDTVTYAGRGGAVSVTIDAGTDDDGSTAEADNVLSVETVIGGNGNDSLTGSGGNELLVGGLGDDSLSGGGGNDTLQGGNSTMTGNTGADTLDGGNGTDVADFSAVTLTLKITLDNLSNDGVNNGAQGANVRDNIEIILNGRGNNTIVGTVGDDCIVGSNGNDCIVGGGGNDTLVGLGGGDVLDGGAGDDCLVGGDGQDILRGGDNNDSLLGGAGSDQIRGGAGIDFVSYNYESRAVRVTLDGIANDGATGENDQIFADVENIEGGRGSDELIGSDAANKINGGPGNDVIKGGGGNDSLYGEAANDTLDGGIGNDLLIGGAGSDRFIGGKNRDTIDYSDRTVALFLSMDNKVNDGAKNEFDNITADIEILIGGSGNDSIFGNQYNSTLIGNDGKDTLVGMGGIDSILGGDGDDSLFSNNSAGTNDLVTDILDGGNGTDSVKRDGSDTILNIP